MPWRDEAHFKEMWILLGFSGIILHFLVFSGVFSVFSCLFPLFVDKITKKSGYLVHNSPLFMRAYKDFLVMDRLLAPKVRGVAYARMLRRI
jgi:hypothetical protein